MNKELYFIGEPFQFKPGILIYPPKVKDVITNQYYGHFGKLLTQSQEDIEDRFIEEKNPQEVYPTPFEALLNNCYNHKDFEKLAVAAFKFFIHQDVTMLYEQKMILIGNAKEVVTKAKTVKDLVLLTEDDFLIFKMLFVNVLGKSQLSHPIQMNIRVLRK